MDLAERARRRLIRYTRVFRAARRRLKLVSGTVTQRKVDFVVAGTMKGGTTALDEYLRLHPELCMAQEKEVHYFNFDEHFANGKPDYDWYHTFFSPTARHKAIGEATPGYMFFPNALPRLRDYNPRMKLVMVLRNPVDRAYSQWNMNRANRDKSKEPMPFREAILAEADRLSTGSFHDLRRFSYLARGLYAQQLRRVWEYFPREQTLVLKTEDMRVNPQETLGSIFEFLGVAPLPHVEHHEALVGSYGERLSDDDRRYVAALFESDVTDLEGLLGWDCSRWRP